MIISHSKKFIYFKGPKVAGTSVEIYFENRCNPSVDVIGYRGPNPKPEGCEWWNHMVPSQIKSKVDQNVWDNYFKFACIRNPWDRLVSYYFWNIHAKHITEQVSFKSFCQELEGFSLVGFYQLKQDPNNVDFFVKFENLKDDIKKVCERLDIEYEYDTMPFEKKTIHKPYEEYYTKEIKDIVYPLIKDDLEYFQYQ